LCLGSNAQSNGNDDGWSIGGKARLADCKPDVVTVEVEYWPATAYAEMEIPDDSEIFLASFPDRYPVNFVASAFVPAWWI
jgi:hypothetical protein